jgi:hypothetical protein
MDVVSQTRPPLVCVRFLLSLEQTSPFLLMRLTKFNGRRIPNKVANQILSLPPSKPDQPPLMGEARQPSARNRFPLSHLKLLPNDICIRFVASSPFLFSLRYSECPPSSERDSHTSYLGQLEHDAYPLSFSKQCPQRSYSGKQVQHLCSTMSFISLPISRRYSGTLAMRLRCPLSFAPTHRLRFSR